MARHPVSGLPVVTPDRQVTSAEVTDALDDDEQRHRTDAPGGSAGFNASEYGGRRSVTRSWNGG